MSGDGTGQARSGTAVAVLCGVQFVDVLGGTVVITALPAMLADLEASDAAAGPLVTGYAIFFGSLLMLAARIGDRYGHRRVLQFGVALFAVASLVAATAPSAAVLIAARCAQGMAAAASVPAALRLLSAAAPDEAARRRALAAWSATGAAAGACGLLLGGVLTDLAGWRSLFWLNLPLAAVLAASVRRAVPTTEVEPTGALDALGAALLIGAVAAVVLGASLLESPQRRGAGLLLVLLGTVLLPVLRRVERRAPDPLLPAAALRSPTLRTGVAASFVNTAATTSAVTLATLHLQDQRDASPTTAGLMLLPFSLMVVVGASCAPRLLRATSPARAAGVGLAVIALGDLALLAESRAAWVLPAAVGIAGAGIGIASVAATTAGTDVARRLQGTAAGALNTAAQLGTALGVAGVLLLATSTADSDLPLTGTPLGWAAAAALAAVSALALLTSRPGPAADGDDDGDGTTRSRGELPVARVPRRGPGAARTRTRPR